MADPFTVGPDLHFIANARAVNNGCQRDKLARFHRRGEGMINFRHRLSSVVHPENLTALNLSKISHDEFRLFSGVPELYHYLHLL